MSSSLAELAYGFRSAARLSQEALAERAGLSTRTVSDIETGAASAPRLITLVLLAQALGLSDADRARLQNSVRRSHGKHARTQELARPPVAPASLVGRDADAARVAALLTTGRARLVTLVGPAGVGKTSLAIGSAGDIASSFESGAAVVELAPLRDASLVTGAVAQSLGIRESGDAAADDPVIAYLRDRSLLLVLDNLEHLTPAARWIGELLAACPRVAILATSREPLHLRSEHVHAVRPLDKDSAVALFVMRAQMAQPDFEPRSNLRAVETIVTHLEGIPLAIELAAPQLSFLPPAALAARIERRLPLLGNVASDRPQRQQTMQHAIAWSYDLLSPQEQRLFRRLSVLHGGGTLEAVAAVSGDGGDEPAMLLRVAPLVEKNMVILAEDAVSQLRVSMLEMLREYAQERLVDAGTFDEVRQRHADFVLEYAKRAERELSGSAQKEWLAKLELEHANVRAALEWLAHSGAILSGFRLIACVWRFWWLRGHLAEGLRWIERFLRLKADASDEVPDAICGKVLRAQTVLLSTLGNFDQAWVSCNAAIELQRAASDALGVASSLTSLGIILQYRGELDRAQTVHEESLAIRRQLGDQLGIATSLSNLSSVAFSKDDLPAASRFGDESATIYRRLGHQSGLAHALMKIGLVAARQCNYAGAEEMFGECLRVQQDAGDTNSMHYSLANLGNVAHRRGEYALALDRYRKALDLLDQTPNKAALAKTLEDIATTIAAIGDPARAARLFSAADVLRRATGVPVFAPEQAEYRAALASIRTTLGADAFGVQWHLGAGLTLQRALDEARG